MKLKKKKKSNCFQASCDTEKKKAQNVQRNTKISSTQQSKIHNVQQFDEKNYKACKEAGKYELQ